MVNLNGFPVTIDSLTEGRCQGILSFKLDMIYFPEIIHCVAGGKKLKEMVSIDLIAFDISVGFGVIPS